jgi:hypothetical protein
LLAIHAGAERGEFMLDERLINLREPVGRHLDGRRIAQMWKSEARPGPVHRVCDQPRADSEVSRDTSRTDFVRPPASAPHRDLKSVPV